MRIQLPLGHSLLFLGVFLFSLVALLPLRLAVDWTDLDRSGFAAREALGSVWLGGFDDAQVGAIGLGDIQTQLRTLPLLAGQARVDLVRRNGDDRIAGSASVSRHRFALDDFKGKLDVSGLFAPLPVGALDLDDVSYHFSDGLCVKAEGRVSAILTGEVAGIAMPGGLNGTARCEQGALLIPLVSQSGLETLTMTIAGDGHYRMTFRIRTFDPVLRQRLIASGLPAAGDGVAVMVEDDFRSR